MFPQIPLPFIHVARAYADDFGCAGGTAGEHASARSQTSGFSALYQLC